MKAIFVENNIVSVIEVRRTPIADAIYRCPVKEVKILHVNMSTLCMDNKTIPREGEMFEEKDGASQIFRIWKGPSRILERLGGLGRQWFPGTHVEPRRLGGLKRQWCPRS
jgi:hypothetical protein